MEKKETNLKDKLVPAFIIFMAVVVLFLGLLDLYQEGTGQHTHSDGTVETHSR